MAWIRSALSRDWHGVAFSAAEPVARGAVRSRIAFVAAGALLAAGIAGCASMPHLGASEPPPAAEAVPLRIVARAPAAPLELPRPDLGVGGAGSTVDSRAGGRAQPWPCPVDVGASVPSMHPNSVRSSNPADLASRDGSVNPAPARRPATHPTLLASLDGRTQAGPIDTPATHVDGNVSQVSFASEGGDFAPVLDKNAEFIVFASTQHRPTFDLYRKSVDGRAVTLLTDDPSDDMMPSLSPDGTRLAFASNRNGNWDVFTMPVAGGPATQVTSDSDDETHPTWAPDGHRLALSRRNARAGTWEIWIVDADNPGVRTFVCEGFQPRWSPEAGRDRLLFQRARQRGSRLYGLWTIDLVAGEGRNPTEVVSARNAAVVQPTWSPDGARIAFATVVDPDDEGEWPAQSDLWIVHADGSGRTALTGNAFRNMQPNWATDGRIYFTSNRSGVENIWAMSVAGGQVAKGGELAARARRGASEGAAPAGTKAAPDGPDRPSADPTPELLRAQRYAGANEE